MKPTNFPRRKAKKRLEAAARQAAYNKLPRSEQVARMGAKARARAIKQGKL